jgi:hypothetical protein
MYFNFDGGMEIHVCLVFKENAEASILVLKLNHNICLFGQFFVMFACIVPYLSPFWFKNYKMGMMDLLFDVCVYWDL